jgi:hypothetical protein
MDRYTMAPASRAAADQTFVAMEGKAPAGVAALRLLCSVQWSFLRYLAITAERRAKGSAASAGSSLTDAAEGSVAHVHHLRGGKPQRSDRRRSRMSRLS